MKAPKHGRRLARAIALPLACAAAALAAAPAAQAVTTFGGALLSDPGGVAVGDGGAVYVADRLHHRIVEFTSSGAFVKAWGSFGTEHGNPIVHPADGEFAYPADLDTNAAGDVYVVDSGNHRIQRFDKDGAFVGKWGAGGGNGDNSTETDGFQYPSGVGVAPGGDVLVANTGAARVQRYTAAGGFVSAWGTVGHGDGQFQVPYDVAVDGDGNSYVADYDEGRIQKFSSGGAFVASWPGPDNPVRVTVGPGGNVYVVDFGARRIDRYSPGGALLGSVGALDYGGGCPNAADLDGDQMYVAEQPPTPQGGCDSSKGRVVKIDVGQPTAALDAPDLALTGRTVSFDASASSVPFAPVQKFEWDLDGNGSFETDTGASTHATHVFDEPGPVTVRVRARSAQGQTDQASATIGIRRAPPPGPTGASIEGGAQFTNDPHVQLTLRWPAFTRTVTISNDGGFADAQTTAVDSPTAWTLSSTGPERLPKTVYVRFDDSTQTFQDDIILDETDPAVESAELTPLGGAAVSAANVHKRSYRLRLKARDNLSGVVRMQVTADRHRPGKSRKYRRKLKVRLAGTRVYVRVRDKAGNFSHWRKAAAG